MCPFWIDFVWISTEIKPLNTCYLLCEFHSRQFHESRMKTREFDEEKKWNGKISFTAWFVFSAPELHDLKFNQFRLSFSISIIYVWGEGKSKRQPILNSVTLYIISLCCTKLGRIYSKNEISIFPYIKHLQFQMFTVQNIAYLQF